jgi:chemotaxis protein MotA
MDIMTSIGLVFGTVVVAVIMLMGGDSHVHQRDHRSPAVRPPPPRSGFRSALSCTAFRPARNFTRRAVFRRDLADELARIAESPARRDRRREKVDTDELLGQGNCHARTATTSIYQGCQSR